VPVFIFDAATLEDMRRCVVRGQFLVRALAALDIALRRLGYALMLRAGAPEKVLLELGREHGAEVVFCNREYEPAAQQRDARCFNALNGAGLGFESFKDAVCVEEQEVCTGRGQPYTVFTPYAKAWLARPRPSPYPALPPARVPVKIHASRQWPEEIRTAFGSVRDADGTASEPGVREVLDRFWRQHLFTYRRDRDFPARDATSHLSPHLHFGTVNGRTVLAEWQGRLTQASASQLPEADIFLKELIWREFYQQVLANFPRVVNGSFRPEYDALSWSGQRDHFQAWCAGMTGYPMVDAAMRCLNATGWMHNRNRMIVSMFLTKDLLIHWQWGERYFMERLVDGDVAANNGGWQWSAGTGTDAAPYFRIFNPVAQGEKFDPEGEFVRQWVPELAHLPGISIHRPWESPGLRSGLERYPARLVRHEQQRGLCLAMFRAISQRAG
jgi:deoxyribodipyrimidine photo-lyase